MGNAARKPFERQHTHEQTEAAALAAVDQGLTGPRVVELARDGLLTLAGKPLEPYEITADYVRKLASHLRKQRAGKVVSDLASMPPRDAIEALRRRLVNVADAELAAVEKQKPGLRDLSRFRQVIQCVKEAAALPGPKDPRPPAPGQMVGPDVRPTGDRSRSGPAGALMAEHLRSQNEERPAVAGRSNGAS